MIVTDLEKKQFGQEGDFLFSHAGDTVIEGFLNEVMLHKVKRVKNQADYWTEMDRDTLYRIKLQHTDTIVENFKSLKLEVLNFSNFYSGVSKFKLAMIFMLRGIEYSLWVVFSLYWVGFFYIGALGAEIDLFNSS